MEQPNRKKNRLSEYDYSTPGAYFLTICVEGKQCVLGKIVGGGALDAPQVQLSEIGRIAEKYILSGNRIPNVCVDKYVIMPNHIHLLLAVNPSDSGGPSRAPAPTNAIVPHFVSTFKRFCRREMGMQIFQRSYYDHVIRSEKDYLEIWNYIDGNPGRWAEDKLYIGEQ